ncbi:MAG TPA: hypothetical protein VF395_02560 [Polyangiaceae bacterium]
MASRNNRRASRDDWPRGTVCLASAQDAVHAGPQGLPRFRVWTIQVVLFADGQLA